MTLLIFLGVTLSANQANFEKITPFLPTVTSQTKKVVVVDPVSGQIKTTVEVEVADSTDERNRGLGGRESLEQNSGMLFIFAGADRYKFWMKGVKFPLDFIWIKDDEVIDLLPNVPTPEPSQADATLPIYTSVAPIDKVLEVNAGFIQQKNIKIGDKLKTVE